jgi:hypothetical protein
MEAVVVLFEATTSRSEDSYERCQWDLSIVLADIRSKDRNFFFNLCGGTLGTAATTGLLYQPQMIGDGDCGEIGGMNIGRGNRSTRRKPAPAHFVHHKSHMTRPGFEPGPPRFEASD